MLVGTNRAARARGLVPGLALVEARLRVPDLVLRSEDPGADLRALHRIARRFHALTPRVVVDPPEGLLLEVGRCRRLFGGIRGIVAEVAAIVRRLHLEARCGLGSTPEAARLQARFGPRGPIPAAGLVEDPRTAHLLLRLGLVQLDQLQKLPRQALARHLEPDLARRLDALTGRRPEALTSVPEPRRFRLHRHFPEPVQSGDVLLATLAAMVAALVARLERAGRVVRRLRLRLVGADGAGWATELVPSSPTPDPAFLTTLLRLRLERGGMPEAVAAVVLEVVRHEPRRPHQAGFDGREADAEAWRRLIEQLRARLGPRAVRVFEPVDDHRPVRTVRSREADGVPPAPFPRPPGPRPLRWLAEPRPIEVLATVPDGPPMALRTRKGLQRLALLAPMERIEPCWWRKPDRRDVGRDFCAVQTPSGTRLWICREIAADGTPRWYLLGFFDR